LQGRSDLRHYTPNNSELNRLRKLLPMSRQRQNLSKTNGPSREIVHSEPKTESREQVQFARHTFTATVANVNS